MHAGCLNAFFIGEKTNLVILIAMDDRQKPSGPAVPGCT